MEYWFGRFDATISGVGGPFSFGIDPAESIVLRRTEHQSGKATLFLRPISPVRIQLSNLYGHQGHSVSWSQPSTLEIRDRASGDVVVICREVTLTGRGDVFEFHVGKIELTAPE